MKLVLFISQFYLLFLPYIFPQNEKWINYTYNENVESIVGKEDTLWLATSGGLVKYNIITEEKTYYNFCNSGLISNHVAPIALDSLGNVWMWKHFERQQCFHYGSTDYLVKFDGKDWKYYSPGVNICENWGLNPIIMEIDYVNNIWIGTYNNGLINFNGDSWKFYDTTNSIIPSNYIVALDIDKENRVWMGSPDVKGLIMYDQFQWIIFDSTNSSCPNEPIINIKIDSEENKWITTWNTVIKFGGNSWIIEDPEIPDGTYIQPKSIQIDSNDELWLFHSELYHFSKNGWNKFSPKTHREFVICDAFFIDKYDNKWLNSDRGDSYSYTDFFKGGLARFDSNGWRVFNISNSKFKGIGVGTVFKDSKNNIWLVSDLLTKTKDDKWTYYSPKYDWRPIQNITTINEDLYGNLWFGSYWDGLIKFDGSEWEYFNENNSSIPNNNIWDIAIDRDGNPWFTCSYEIGVVKFDGNTFTVYDTTNSGLPENDIRSIESDSEGNLWFGTANNGMVKYDFSSWIIFDKQIKWNSIYGLYIDDEDNVWIGGAGLTKFSNGNWSYYEHEDSIEYYFNVITHLTKDLDNNIWAVARYGLYKFDGANWSKFDHTNSGLPDEFLGDIEFDQFGNLWIATSSGVVLFNETGVISNVDKIDTRAIDVSYELFQNYPNPFNPSTTITYSIPAEGKGQRAEVKLVIYDILGREVETLVNQKQLPGYYEVTWNANNHPSGIYFYRIQIGDFIKTNKMVLLR